MHGAKVHADADAVCLDGVHELVASESGLGRDPHHVKMVAPVLRSRAGPEEQTRASPASASS